VKFDLRFWARAWWTVCIAVNGGFATMYAGHGFMLGFHAGLVLVCLVGLVEVGRS
jgi:hypothetical protein